MEAVGVTLSKEICIPFLCQLVFLKSQKEKQKKCISLTEGLYAHAMQDYWNQH